MGKVLQNKRFFYILTLICLTGFLVLPKICLADNFESIDLNKIDKYLELPEGKVEKLINSLINLFHSEWINLESSGYATEEQSAVPNIMREVTRLQAMNHLLRDVPIEITWGIIKGAVEITKVYFNPSIGLEKLEKLSVEKAIEEGKRQLFGDEIRVTPGAIEFEYPLQKGGKGQALLQYIVVYNPLDKENGEITIRFYSPYSLLPPLNRGSIGGSTGGYYGGTGNIPPFIVEIQGNVEDFEWTGERSVKIDLSGPVPDLGIKPLSLWEKYLLKPIETTIKKVEIIITKVTGKSPGLTDIWDEFKKFIEKIKSFAPAGLVDTSQSTQNQLSADETTQLLTIIETAKGLVEASPQQADEAVEESPQQTDEITLAELQEILDDAAERIDILARQIAELSRAKLEESAELSQVQEQTEEEAVEDVEEEIVEVDPQQNPQQTSEEVCWVDINAASKEELEKIIGIGPTLAQRIIDARPFYSLSDLIRVSGIGEVTLQKIINQGCAYIEGIYFGGSGGGGGSNSGISLDIEPPIANAGPDQNAIINETIKFDGSQSTDNLKIVSYKWDINASDGLNWDNPDFTVKSPTFNQGYSKIGTYTVTLRVSDAAGNSAIDTLTIKIDPPPKILISEIQIDSQKGASDEFIELYNPNNQEVSLKNWSIQRAISDGAVSKKNFESDNTISAKGYFLIVNKYASQELLNLADMAHNMVHNSFNLIAGNTVFLVGNQEEISSGQEETVIDKVGYGSAFSSEGSSAPEPITGQNVGRKWDEATQTYPDTNDNSQDFEIQIPTPKARNQTFISEKPFEEPLPPPKILISEIQIETAISTDYDFIELYNPTTTDIDISDWQLKKRNSNGNESSIKVLPENSIIPAQDYFLWANTEYASSARILADATSSQVLTATNSVALLDKDKNIVDAVAWGVSIAPFVENLPFPQNPETQDPVGKWLKEIGFEGRREPDPRFIFYQSLGRKMNEQGNYLDTDNNAEDFELQNPTPKAKNETFIEPNLEDILRDIDSIPPEVKITSGLPSLTNQAQATLNFQADEENCSFQCQLDSQDWKSCQSPKEYEELSNNQHTFSVKAIDLFSNESLPVEYSWTVDTEIESPTIFLFDLNTKSHFYTNQNEVGVVISVSGSEEEIKWFLSENKEKPTIEDSGWQTEKPENFILSESNGLKTVYIWTKDSAQNVSQLGNSASIILDTISPETIIEDGPAEFANSTQAAFTFSSKEENSTFECKIEQAEQADWEICQSPKIYLDLSEGEHTFSVRAKDLALNIDLSPAQYSWLIDITPPISQVAALKESQTSTTFSVSWSGDDPISGILNYDIQFKDGSECQWQDWLESTSELNGEFSGQDEHTYYFRSRAIDKAGNQESWSDEADTFTKIEVPKDTTPPAAIFDLLAETGDSPGEIKLTWIAPGDDGNIGQASEYIIKYFSEEITEENWDLATQAFNLPSPKEAGSLESFIVSSLADYTVYYFAIKTKDEAQNLSEISNSSFAETPSAILEVSPTQITFLAEYGETSPPAQYLTIENTGLANMNWSISSSLDWLFANPASGTLTASSSTQIEISVDISDLELGIYNDAVLTIEAPDTKNSPTEIPLILNLKDTIPPQPPIITSHTQNQILNSSPITLTGQAEVNTLILIFLNSQNLEVMTNENGNWQKEIELIESQNEIEIIAKDEAGNEGQPANLDLLLDTHSPTVTINELPDLQPHLSFQISWLGDDSYQDLVTSGISGFQFRYSEDGEDWTYYPLEGGYTSETEYTFTGQDQHTYYFQVKASDIAGNESNWQEASTKISLPFLPLSVVINEIAWMGTNASHNHEWIELYNATTTSIDLTGWKLIWKNGSTTIHFGVEENQTQEIATSTIGANSFYLLQRTSNDTVSNIEADLIYTTALRDEGEKLVLYNSDDVIVDIVDASAGWEVFGGQKENRISMERIDSAKAGSDPTNWASNNLITRNGLSAEKDGIKYKINGTPGAENSVSKSETEIFPANQPPFGEGFNEITLTYLGSPYVFRYYLLVPAGKTLNIEPGVVLKFDSGWGVEVDGILKAVGEENGKIIFTSLNEPAYWNGIYFTASSINSELNWTEIRYARDSARDGRPAVSANDSSIILKNSTVEKYNLIGLKLFNSTSTIEKTNFLGSGVTGISIIEGSPLVLDCDFIGGNKYGIYVQTTGMPIIEGNNFEGNEYPIFANSLNVIFKNNRGQNNTINGIALHGNIRNDITWFKNEIPYIIFDFVLIEPGYSLTIEPGITVKGYRVGQYRSYLEIEGRLTAEGTPEEPIVFTSYSSGSWSGLTFSATSQNSILKNVIVEYGGIWRPFRYIWGAVSVVESSIEFIDSVSASSSDAGIYLRNSSSTVENSHFENNKTGITIAGAEPEPQLINNIFSGNQYDICWPSNKTRCEEIAASSPDLIVKCNSCP